MYNRRTSWYNAQQQELSIDHHQHFDVMEKTVMSRPRSNGQNEEKKSVFDKSSSVYE